MSSLTRKRYNEILDSFAGLKIVVLGDLMLDEYLWGRAGRISPEAPVMVVDVERETAVPGGAANVVNNLLSLGAEVIVVGVIGDDFAGRQLVDALSQAGADVSKIVVDVTRPTTRKTRVVAHSQQVLRVDREHTSALSETVEREVLRHFQLALPSANAVLVSDYNKGILSESVARSAVKAATNAGVILTANPKPPNAAFLAGASVLSLNLSEGNAAVRQFLGETRIGFDDDTRLRDLGEALRSALDVVNLVVTRGPKGLTLWSEGRFVQVHAHAVEVYDVAGAGDTVISTLTASLAGGASLAESAGIANHAAACVIRKLGVATVTPQELRDDWRS